MIYREGSTNLFYTDERVDDRVANLIVDGVGITKNYDDAGNLLNIAIDFTEFDSDDIIEGSVNTYLASRTTDNIPEGSTNLYYTDGRADGRIAAASIGDLSDVDITTTAPTDEQVLVWDAANSQFIPGDAAADFTDLTGQIAAIQIPNDIITTAMMNYTVNVFSQEFTADGINNTYTLTSDPGSKNAIQVFVDGVPQRASNYTVVGTTLTLGGTPALMDQLVEVRGYGVALASWYSSRQ